MTFVEPRATKDRRTGSAHGYPDASPNVLTVGGTTLTLKMDGSYNVETGWSGTTTGNSQYESEPAYQVKRGSRTRAASGKPPTWLSSQFSYRRGGIRLVRLSRRQWLPGRGKRRLQSGGPLLGRPDRPGRSATGGRARNGGIPLDGPTQTLPALYALNKKDFHDITKDDTAAGNGTYHSASGYDEVTGWGTPIANLLVPDLAAYASPPLTWTGKGDGVHWSDPNNWDLKLTPSFGCNLIFPTNAKSLKTTNDLTGLQLNSIDLKGGGYDLNGNAISLSGGLTSEAGANTFELDTTLVGSPVFKDLVGDLTLNSVLSGDGGLTFDGSGMFTLDKDDTYGGATTLDAGVTLDDTVADAFDSLSLVIGAGSKPVSIDAGGSGSSPWTTTLRSRTARAS